MRSAGLSSISSVEGDSQEKSFLFLCISNESIVPYQDSSVFTESFEFCSYNDD